MKNSESDIYDLIVHLPVICLWEKLLLKYKALILYLFFGGIAFFLNIGLFAFFNKLFSINELIANAMCWVICVLFQFVTNRTMVFNVVNNAKSVIIKQLGSFICGRLFTLLIEELILYIFVTRIGLNSIIIKLIAQVIVIILNYVISKLFVFTNNESKND